MPSADNLDTKVLESLAQSPKSRKDLLESGIACESSLDKSLKRLRERNRIKFEVIDTRTHRRSGMNNFICESNPKIRIYSLVQQEREVHME
jgi:hypothetical protein